MVGRKSITMCLSSCEAGAVMGVSGKAVDMARKIKTEGIPELAVGNLTSSE